MRTHWNECWRDPTHHACAVAKIDEALSMIARLSRPVTEREPPHCPTCECGMEPGELARIVAAAKEQP